MTDILTTGTGLIAAGVAAVAAVRWKRFNSSLKGSLPVDYVLHLYDHCPYCIRVELMLGWKGVRYTRKVYGYGDMVGPTHYHPHQKKELPVLEIISSGKCISESKDIIEYIEKKTEGKLITDYTLRDDVKQFFDTKGPFKIAQRMLTR